MTARTMWRVMDWANLIGLALCGLLSSLVPIRGYVGSTVVHYANWLCIAAFVPFAIVRLVGEVVAFLVVRGTTFRELRRRLAVPAATIALFVLFFLISFTKMGIYA